MLILQFLTAALIVAVDYVTKFLCVRYLQPIGKVPIIEGVFNLRFAENTGAAFSMLSGQRTVLIALPLIAVAVMIYVLATRRISSKVG